MSRSGDPDYRSDMENDPNRHSSHLRRLYWCFDETEDAFVSAILSGHYMYIVVWLVWFVAPGGWSFKLLLRLP